MVDSRADRDKPVPMKGVQAKVKAELGQASRRCREFAAFTAR
ncbi:hypothetical protein [Novosphingopyxis sp.]